MSLEKKRLEAELARVYAARLELEFKQEEYKYNIERLQKEIDIQLKRESELKGKINQGG
jgi:hypothetical protein